MINVEEINSIIINSKPQLLQIIDKSDAINGITAKYMSVDYRELK